MKNKILVLIIVLALIAASGCTIQLPAPVTDQMPASQTNAPDEGNNNNNTNQNNAPADATPEPTQQFVENQNQATAHVQPTPNPNTASHSDMMGLWLVAVWDDINTAHGEFTFYEITSSMINESSHSTTTGYGNFNYTYQNGVVTIGNSAYDAVFDQGMLAMTSQSTGELILLQSVTETEIQNMVGSSSNTDTSSWEIITPTPLSVQFEIVPTGPSGRTGIPYYGDELAYNIPESDLASEIVGKTWYTYGYLWSDSTITHDFAMYSEYVFNSDYSYSLKHSFGTDTGLFEIEGVGLELFLGDGSMRYYSQIYIVENQSTGYSYLFISDEEPGYENCFIVYEGY